MEKDVHKNMPTYTHSYKPQPVDVFTVNPVKARIGGIIPPTKGWKFFLSQEKVKTATGNWSDILI